VLGVQKVEDKAIANTDVTKLGGLATKVWGLNDDATHNYVPNNPGSLKGVMAYDDLAMWTRRLTLDELKTINGSHQPLSSLNPGPPPPTRTRPLMKPCIHPLARPHRLAAVLLCAVTLSLSACGGDSNDGTPCTGTGHGT
ncbi:hypothetical protein, partial [Acinetobacter baumannii]|uniref:hypothetical protein n=1 Tax=Acinetobacter baumannii TaxID=470 RepID=UPI001C0A0AD9